MKNIKGIKINHFDFSLSKLGDLIFHENPILSHFTNEFGWNFFMYWCDNDDNYNRWLLCRVNKD